MLSLSLLPLYAAFVGFARVAAIGFGENALQALAQGVLAGPAALYLFAFSIQASASPAPRYSRRPCRR